MKYRKILLIDDDEDDQLIFKEAIHESIYEIECITAYNCKEGLALLKLVPHPDLVFLDINMPLLNGFDCLKLIKDDPQVGKIPVIIFSTSDNPADKKNAFKLGAEKYITKTSSFESLKNNLAEILA